MSLQEILDNRVPADVRAELEAYLDSHLSENGGIPKSRFDEVIGQRNALREQLAENTREIEALHTRFDSLPEIDSLREENETLTRQVAETRRREWAQYEPLFRLEPGHPLYTKVQRIRDEFDIPENDTECTPETVERNLSAIRPYLNADYFEVPAPVVVDAAKPAALAIVSTRQLGDLFKAFGG
jgi:predicted nuclease with TOPRIM domain